MGASCRLLPHGGYALVPIVLTTVAWIASIFQDGCDYAIIEGPVVQVVTDENSVPWVEVGYAAYRTPEYNRAENVWVVTHTGHCTDYDLNRMDLDPAWKTAKAFAFLALALGGGGALFLWFSVCCIFSKATWRWAGYEVLLASIFQALAFLWFGNSYCTNRNVCSLSWGSKADMVACTFWALAASAIFCKYPIPNFPRHDRSMEAETTNPEITITRSEQNPSFGRHNHFAVQIASSTVAPPRSSYEGSAHLAAALPLDGDATATITNASTSRQHSGYEQANKAGRVANDVEVL